MLEAFHFIRPLWLLALLPLGMLAWRLARQGGGDNPWQRTVDPALLPLLMIGGAGGGRPGMLRLLVAGWTLAALALAGPTWQRKPQPVFQTGAARVVVLDLSTSMQATDLKPSRLERARFKVEDVLALGQEGQTGLVVYAGDAFAVAPLTRDANTVSALLRVLGPDLMPVQGSRADLGLLEAEKLMQQAGLSSGQVLLIADGVDPEHAAAARDAAARLRGHGYRVSVLGVGTAQGAPVADAQGQFMRDAAGQPALARLDAAALQDVARAGGGQYQSVTDSGDALRTLLETDGQALIDPSQDPAGAMATAWVEQGPWLVLLLLPLAALAFRRGALIADAPAAAVPPSRPRPGRPAGQVLPLLALGLVGTMAALPTPVRASPWQDAWQRPDQQAAAALAAGDYAKAATLATDAERRGSAEYKRGNYAAALQNFAQATGPRANYNRGNALAQLGRYADAVAAYDKALSVDPGNADAKANKAAVEALLRQQQQQEQKQKQKQDSKPKDGPAQDQPSQQGQQQGQQQASKSGEGSAADKSAQHGAQPPTNGASKAQSDAAGQSAAAAASAAQGQQAQASPSRPEAKDGAAGQRGGESGQDAAADQRQPTPAPKPGDSFAEAARKLAAKEGAAKSDDAAASNGGAAAERQAQTATAAEQAKAAGARDAQPIPSEEQLAAQQWLRRIPDDPGGLLRRKFLYQYQQRAREGGG